MSSIENQIIQFIQQEAPLPVRVKRNSNVLNDLGFDSLSFFTLLLTMEEKFSVNINIQEMESCLLVNNLIEIIERKRRGNNL